MDEKTSLQENIGLALDEEIQEERPRAPLQMEEALERKRDFREVEKGFDKEQARYEAMRCLRCDLENKMRGDDT